MQQLSLECVLGDPCSCPHNCTKVPGLEGAVQEHPSSSNCSIYHLPTKMHLPLAKRPIRKGSEWKRPVAQRGRLHLKTRTFLLTCPGLILSIVDCGSLKVPQGTRWESAEMCVWASPKGTRGGQVRLCVHNTSYTDVQSQPTCCVALPGERGQVRVNIEDSIRHSLLHSQRPLPGRGLVGKFLRE